MNNNKLTKFQIDLLKIHLANKLSIKDDPVAIKVIKHYFKEIESGSPTIKGDSFATIIKQDIERVIHDNGNRSMIWDQLKNENNFLRRELHRLKKSKAKPKTYKYMVRNSLGNANFNVNKVASYLNNSPASNLVINEFLNTATQQLIDLIHMLGVNNGK